MNCFAERTDLDSAISFTVEWSDEVFPFQISLLSMIVIKIDHCDVFGS